MIYIPSIVPAVCTAMVWLFIMNTQYGAINGLLKTAGFPTIPFLSSPSLAKPSLIMIYVWAQGTVVVIFLAALQDVPRSLYDLSLIHISTTAHRSRRPSCGGPTPRCTSTTTTNRSSRPTFSR